MSSHTSFGMKAEYKKGDEARCSGLQHPHSRHPSLDEEDPMSPSATLSSCARTRRRRARTKMKFGDSAKKKKDTQMKKRRIDEWEADSMNKKYTMDEKDWWKSDEDSRRILNQGLEIWGKPSKGTSFCTQTSCLKARSSMPRRSVKRINKIFHLTNWTKLIKILQYTKLTSFMTQL